MLEAHSSRDWLEASSELRNCGFATKICGEEKRKSEGTVRPFCGSTKGPIRFVLPQKGETKGKLMTKNRILVSREHDTMSRGEGEGGGKAGRA